MKNRKPDLPTESALTTLDPSHPNYDAILLKRSRLEAHRRRRMENKGELAPVDRVRKGERPGKKKTRRKDD